MKKRLWLWLVMLVVPVGADSVVLARSGAQPPSRCNDLDGDHYGIGCA